MTTIEEALDTIHGPRETYRPLLESDAIIRRICRTAEIVAQQKGVEPWSIVGEWTGHGSGVSNAIYQVYRAENGGESSPFAESIRAITQERERQRRKGYDESHDDDHEAWEIAKQAAEVLRSLDDDDHVDDWGIAAKWRNDEYKKLVIAAALIVAEMERYSRYEADMKGHGAED